MTSNIYFRTIDKQSLEYVSVEGIVDSIDTESVMYKTLINTSQFSSCLHDPGHNRFKSIKEHTILRLNVGDEKIEFPGHLDQLQKRGLIGCKVKVERDYFYATDKLNYEHEGWNYNISILEPQFIPSLSSRVIFKAERRNGLLTPIVERG